MCMIVQVLTKFMQLARNNCWYIGSSNGLTEINLTTGRVRRLLNYYVRDLGFKSDKELWVGTESGLYIYDLEKGEIAHLTVSNGNDSYALADNAIYSICRDNDVGVAVLPRFRIPFCR